MIIREMRFDDISPVAELERAYSLTPWDENGLLTYLLREDALFLVASDEFPEDYDPEAVDEENFFWPEIYGYVGLLMVPYEADVLNITVSGKVRNRGIGTRLMREILERAKKYGVTDIHLEVRESNEAAIHLYEKLGFLRDGIRKNYYTAPVENAVTMTVRQELTMP
ncbi:MAG: ribosomal protein S18-alanine N-acetyltransferase [Lachnospiraceae bacterium]|jgi:ribosomal-protein-alanine N-acetyltransferase|nr:ribosomal protein S18-alanine N-acetyltransferase [Lachnospiraceae bacterium]